MRVRPNIYKSPDEMRRMLRPGLATAASLTAARSAIVSGATTRELDLLAEAAIRVLGGVPNFMKEPGYRHTICASINEDIVHGIPGERALVAGDIVSIDSGAEVGGWNGDAAITVVLPDPDRPDRVAELIELSDVTEQSLWCGIAALASASHLGEVGGAIEDYIGSRGTYGILEDYTGHGIGRSMHEEPPVFNYRIRDRGPRVRPGLVVAIEPMVTLGGIETFVRQDGWTVATSDGTASAHWEHSIAVHDDGIWVLTADDGGAAGLAPFGVTPVPLA
ncbi:MAG: type I methionyl aminopeptidase [Terrimesophilobacter sp.]